MAMARVNIDTLTIHGEKDQHERSDVLDQFKSGDANILIATDVSARGIDIPHIEYVINYDLPEVAENYVHRVGRTGRGINKGTAISFCADEEKEILAEIQSLLKKEIQPIRISKGEYKATLAASSLSMGRVEALNPLQPPTSPRSPAAAAPPAPFPPARP